MTEIWKQMLVVFMPLLSVFMLWLMGKLIKLAGLYAAKVEDDTFRAWLLELVKAAEQMIPTAASGAEKLAKVQGLAPGATREEIEAAVKTMKDIESRATTLLR